MENRLEVQSIQGDELFMELTPEELQELEQVKGGFSFPKSNDSLPNGIPALPISKIKELDNPPDIVIPDKPFPYGIPAIFKSNALDISKDISKQGLKS
ncbi:hypothetical protein [Nostoc sp. CHAB 5715]|uniref:hypothetical protein n=1 Tax=Nostoc sp. CHAB 5715 TaxID=2780400 RepID=UPI001E390DF9|nr:hypothetical protein [Nostoc sp. CHAB 5715]MCC5623170.1 hypothetical protein [Nostoc sp. CHAB 5715]